MHKPVSSLEGGLTPGLTSRERAAFYRIGEINHERDALDPVARAFHFDEVFTKAVILLPKV
jgi:hypothetical protein